MKLIDHLNKVSQERGFDNFQNATNEGMKYVIDSIIEEAGNRYKNEN